MAYYAKVSMLAATVVVLLVACADAGNFNQMKAKDFRRRSHERRQDVDLPEILEHFNDEDTDEQPYPSSLPPTSASATEVAQHKAKLLEKVFWNTRFMDDIEPDSPTTVAFGLSIISVRYDSTTGLATTNAWERMTWNDNRLAWSPDDFGNITMIRLPLYYVWRPDITLYSAYSQDRSDSNVVVYYSGEVIWVPQAQYQTYCNQSNQEVSCAYKLGSWTYSGFEVNLVHWEGETDVEVRDFDRTCGATITSHSALRSVVYYPCCPEPYPDITSRITFTPRGSGN